MGTEPQNYLIEWGIKSIQAFAFKLISLLFTCKFIICLDIARHSVSSSSNISKWRHQRIQRLKTSERNKQKLPSWMDWNFWHLVSAYKTDYSKGRNEEQLPFPMLATEYLNTTQIYGVYSLSTLVCVMEPLILCNK